MIYETALILFLKIMKERSTGRVSKDLVAGGQPYYPQDLWQAAKLFGPKPLHLSNGANTFPSLCTG